VIPSDPAGNDAVIMLITVTTVRLSWACAESGPPGPADESVTCTVKVKVPGTVGSPAMTPELLNDKPVGKAPLAKIQVSVPTPPVDCRVAV
jgi:hypothetical protein